MSKNTGFYEELPRIARFEALTDPASYTPIPDDWMIATADIVGSTELITDGKYKLVNMIGAAVISAHINASGGQAFPYVFGGDGATLAVDPARRAESARILGVLKRWADEEFGVSLRIAQVSVADVRAAGFDVSVARYQASGEIDYAMFSGGGVSWAEAKMKAGENALPAAPAGAVPDLEGLSCRWSNAAAKNGSILSVVVRPVPGRSGAEFDRVTHEIVQLAQRLSRSGHPLPPEGPGLQFPPPGLNLEAHVSRGKASLFRRRLELVVGNLIAWVFFKAGLKTGDFEPAHYKAMVSTNADFRKFDDGLKMTLDCDAETQRQIRAVLETAQADGILRFGLVEQDAAMITCFVPSIHQDDHIHLVDGASGGYARAAAQMKSKTG
ncbi:DUF3095 domain-containing protein [Sedimentitalea todarodis]|uniref:DUF3095 domain-containing protein n=1 Tax=Sedimentitalea todarodis TaxID=1631240 RepID=A0ABU3VBM7_9RHOB|nr:DUF3095 domain-containing protein [Sedimentitalea todarodis]MDU9003164.1 DUF3095 domain-containing protein [Sedimentitalea todarodis]